MIEVSKSKNGSEALAIILTNLLFFLIHEKELDSNNIFTKKTIEGTTLLKLKRKYESYKISITYLDPIEKINQEITEIITVTFSDKNIAKSGVQLNINHGVVVGSSFLSQEALITLLEVSQKTIQGS